MNKNPTLMKFSGASVSCFTHRIPHVPNLDIWKDKMQPRRDEAALERIVQVTQLEYQSLYAHHNHINQRATRWHLVNRILPGLALYRSLLGEHHQKDRALSEAEALIWASEERRYKSFLQLLHIFPGLLVLRGVMTLQMRLYFPSRTWEITWLEKSHRRIAFHIRRCIYLDILSDCGAAELTPVFCKMDEYLANAFPAHIGFARTKTLASGADCCDFCYFLKEP